MITDNRYSGPDQVRDQRVAPWFSIDHAVILDWLPVIGQTGYALYSIYMSLAAQKLPSPGIRRLANHVTASPQSIIFANRVLEWAGLIAITAGDHETSNIYDVLDVPAVSEERLQYIAAAALEDAVLQQDYAAYYRRRLLDACQHWQPFWQRRAGILRAKAEPEPEPAPPTLLRAKGAEPDPATAVPPEPADLAARLAAIGLADGKAAELIAAHEPGYLAGWLSWIENKAAEDPRYFKRSIAGYLLRVVANGDQAPEPPAVEPEHLCSLCQKRPVSNEGELCQNCQEKYADFVRR